MRIPQDGIMVFYTDHDAENEKIKSFAENFMGRKEYINVDREQLTAEYFDIKRTPVIVGIRDGKEIARITADDGYNKIKQTGRLIVA